MKITKELLERYYNYDDIDGLFLLDNNSFANLYNIDRKSDDLRYPYRFILWNYSENHSMILFVSETGLVKETRDSKELGVTKILGYKPHCKEDLKYGEPSTANLVEEIPHILSEGKNGLFVLEDFSTISAEDMRIQYQNQVLYMRKINALYFRKNDRESLKIIDFIPNADKKNEISMKTDNVLNIEIPKGKQIDWDESKKQNKIILEDMPTPIITYEDVCNKLSDKNSGHFYINGVGDIEHSYNNPGLINTASSEHQLECILAKNKLANVAVYLNDGWKPTKGTSVWVIEYDCYLGYHARSIQEGSIAFNCYGLVIFKSEELAHQAIEILGEETVKLALEPLGL